MPKRYNPFGDIFDDVSDLTVTKDADGIVQINGVACLADMDIKITIERSDSRKRRKAERAASKNDSSTDGTDTEHTSVDTSNLPAGKFLYAGTVSLLDPDGRVMVSKNKQRQKSEKDGTTAVSTKACKASATFRCNSPHLKDIKSRLRSIVDRLILENGEQHFAHLALRITPDQVTPLLAVHQYADDFLAVLHPNSKKNPDRKQAIKKVFEHLRNVPIGTLSGREVKKILKDNNVTENDQELCYLFVEYLINEHKITGKNPIPSRTVVEKTPEQLDREAFSAYTIDPPVYNRLIRLLNEELTILRCVVAMLISGFTLTDIRNTKWSHIEFVLGYIDFASIHIRRDHYVIAKHDFTRPCLTDVALYLRKVYEALCDQYTKEVVDNCYVWSMNPESAPEELSSAVVSKEANDLLVRAGYIGSYLRPGRPSNGDETIPISILRSNYASMLALGAGLSNDPDTSHFLRGVLLKSSTYTNYESHTSPEAQYRLYTDLKPLAVEVKLRQVQAIRRTKNGYVYTATPETNHHAVIVHGQLRVPPGARIKTSHPHGSTGSLKINSDTIQFSTEESLKAKEEAEEEAKEAVEAEETAESTTAEEAEEDN